MRPVTRWFLVLAAVCGVVHAAASLYWAFGGEWLLDTVGRDVVEMVRDTAGSGAVLLLGVVVVKLAGVVVPFLVEDGRLGPRRVWRTIEWVGAAVLALYGGLVALVANLVLAGLIARPSDYDDAGTKGHAWLWDPLFFAWAAFLLVALWTSRRTSGARRETPDVVGESVLM